jgi:CPA2 family monovalent cation:H+ antiporter-2
MRHTVFGLGMAQVLLTIAVTMLFGWLVARGAAATDAHQLARRARAGRRAGDEQPPPSSSKMLTERLELESEHGRRVIGILLFQDLAVVPLLILIPALANPPSDLLRDAGLAALKAAVCWCCCWFLGQR